MKILKTLLNIIGVVAILICCFVLLPLVLMLLVSVYSDRMMSVIESSTASAIGYGVVAIAACVGWVYLLCQLFSFI
jgi:hypothetical protein